MPSQWLVARDESRRERDWVQPDLVNFYYPVACLEDAHESRFGVLLDYYRRTVVCNYACCIPLNASRRPFFRLSQIRFLFCSDLFGIRG